MTELSDELLVAYVDGQLARKQIRALEKVLAQDDVTAARVTALQEAHSRVKAAFEAILAGEVSEISNQAAPVEAVKGSERGALTKASLAVAGIVITLIAMAAGYGWPSVFPGLAALRSDAQPQNAEVGSPTWKEEAARASALLSRASWEASLESQGNPNIVAFRLAQVLGSVTKVPDLGPQGFRFMRAHLLKAGDRPMAQMLYLPASGTPLALYATLGEGWSIPVFKQDDAIGTVSWNDKGIAYLLAGEQAQALLFQLAEKIRHEPTKLAIPPVEHVQLLAEPQAAPEVDAEPIAAVAAAEASELNSNFELPEKMEGAELLKAAKPEASLVAYEEPSAQDEANSAGRQPGPSNDPDSKIFDAELAAAAGDADSAGQGRTDRTQADPVTGIAASPTLDATNRATPALDPAAPTAAAEVPERNSDVEFPGKVEGAEPLEPVKPVGGFVANKARTALSKANVVNLQQPMPPPVKKLVANKGKPAPARLAVKLKETDALKVRSKPKSKPMALGTAEGSLKSPLKATASPASASGYATKVWAALARHKPKSVGASGSATVSFVISASGAVLDVHVTRSSGKGRVDQAALSTVRNAAPFPPPPRGVGQPSYTIKIDFR